MIPGVFAESNYGNTLVIPEEVTVIEFGQFNLVRVHLTVTNNDDETFEPRYSYLVTGSSPNSAGTLYENENYIDEVGSKTCPFFGHIELNAGTTDDFVLCFKLPKKPLDAYWLHLSSSSNDYCSKYPGNCEQQNYMLYNYATPEYTDYESYKKNFIRPLEVISAELTNFGLREKADLNILFITVSITNESNEEYTISSRDVIAENDKGQKFSHEYRFFSDCSSGYEDLNPGLTKSLSYCFEIPKDQYEFDIVIRADWSRNCDHKLADCQEKRISVNVEPTQAVPTSTSTVPAQQTGGGCGTGTVLVNGVCQLVKTSATEDFDTDGSRAFGAIAGIFLFFILAVIAIIVIIIIIAVLIKRRKKLKLDPPTKQDLDDYESQYLSRQKIEPKRKPAEKKETSMFCDSCGAAFKKSTAKFCGGCGTPRS